VHANPPECYKGTWSEKGWKPPNVIPRPAMSNPRAACGLVEVFLRPSKLFIIMYVEYNDRLSSF